MGTTRISAKFCVERTPCEVCLTLAGKESENMYRTVLAYYRTVLPYYKIRYIRRPSNLRTAQKRRQRYPVSGRRKRSPMPAKTYTDTTTTHKKRPETRKKHLKPRGSASTPAASAQMRGKIAI